ncbi:hypothetical protein FD723_39885 (plasmid) [Nostoc sp. C052]|uniref:hypothetical protein n=1 Tax=Nostoc sp. C052 TaxID=2576902 RepID=UPI0015C3CC92|nr:hypothetical protein [Nostoc sp. C052]QLE46374.1 hypothetical protein FD723_39885 [Nostoc sp. C052]
MATTLETTTIFGPPLGAAGVRVREVVGSQQLRQPNIGVLALFSPLQRGPSDVPVTVTSREQYDQIFGDPQDVRWHLYPDGSQMGPDAIDGFFTMAGQSGTLIVTRLGLDGKGKRASLSLKNRQGREVLRLSAGNEGRWGGYEAHIPWSTLIVSTARTFTIYAPGVERNEFIGAKISFSSDTGKEYDVVSNTASNDRGETIFTISSQYDLIADGIDGPVTLSGLASYSSKYTLAGTVAFPLMTAVTGTVAINGTVVTGTGTRFSEQLEIGDNIYYQGEARSVESISSNTTLTIGATFTNDGITGASLEKDNLILTGVGTTFTDLIPGNTIYAEVDNKTYSRKIASIVSPTQLQLESGFPVEVSAGSQASVDNFWVEAVVGSETSYGTELTVGSSIIDPNRSSDSVSVVEIDKPNQRFKIDQKFSKDFTASQITKQNQKVKLDLIQKAGTGLSVEVGLGLKKPETHFSLFLYFNGKRVMQIADASLDPTDDDFVESLINDSNIAYRSEGKNYYTWIECENLWNGIYTTASTNDIRPSNGAGKTLLVTERRIYTVGEFDYSKVINAPLYPNPYKYARNSVRIRAAAAPVLLEGSISSTGVQVFGTNTNFTSVFRKGDYLYDPNSDTIRPIRRIVDDEELILETMFAVDLPAETKASKAGYLQVDQGVNLTEQAAIGDRFIVAYRESFVGGYDGDLGSILPFHYTKFFNVDKDLLGRAIYGKGYGLVRIICPGIHDTTIQSQGGNYAAQTACEYRIEFPPHINSVAVAEAFITSELGKNSFFSAAFPSYGYISSPLSRGKRFISINGDIAGLESAVASLREGWHHPAAGLDAALSRIEQLPIEISPPEQATLNNAGIQPILKLLGRTVIYGAEVPATDPMFTLLHVRRMQSNYARVLLEAITLQRSLFKPNSPSLSAGLYMVLNEYFQSEYRKGALNNYLPYSQAVQINFPTPNTATTQQSSRDTLVALATTDLIASIIYCPTGILKNFFINLGPDSVTSSFASL